MRELAKLNFRDLGGLPARGGVVRRGVLFRAEGPANLAPEHRSELRSLGIGYVFDLRSSEERKRHPHDWHDEECRVLDMQVNADLRVFGNDGSERLSVGEDAQLAIDIMCETYREIPDALAPHWKTVGECLLEGRPTMINCTAGKDRTGVAVAILLEMLGTPRDAILHDYRRSEIFGENLRRSGALEDGFQSSFGFMPSPPQVEALIGVRRDYLQAAWDEIEAKHRSVSRYLADAGLAKDMQIKLQSLLVAQDIASTHQGGIA
jgi:protein-tyrosine phosphatase